MGGKTQQSSQVWRLARQQHDVITREQLPALGYSRKAIEHRLRNERLHRTPWRGVYSVGRPISTRFSLLMAAVSACGDGAALSHRSAGEVYGICRPLPGDIQVSTLGADRSRDGIALHRRAALTVVRRELIPVTNPVDTLVDMAAIGANVAAAVNEADKLDVIHPEPLRRALDHVDPRPGVPLLRTLIDRETFTFTDSELERFFLPIARRAGLPRPLTQVWLNGHRVDFFFRELRLVVETNGGRYHRTPFQQTQDARRAQALFMAELIPLHFTHGQIRYAPREVEDVLRAAAARCNVGAA